MPPRKLATLLLIATVAACSGDSSEMTVGRLTVALRSEARSPLFVHFPELDHRIVRLDPPRYRLADTYYPDLWEPGMRSLKDFAVDKRAIYALLARRQQPDDPRLFVVQQQGAKVRSLVDLPPSPQILGWACDGRLLVGHATSVTGPAGRVTVLNPKAGRIEAVVSLQGACQALAATAGAVFVIERSMRATGRDVLMQWSLAEVDLRRRAVRRRRSLPPGATHVVVGPHGLLNISQASGPGTLATDGTVSVVDPRSLRLVRRLRLEMVVKGMAATNRSLVLSMISQSGETWIEIQDGSGATVHDLRPGELVGPDITVLGKTAYLPLRRGSSLMQVDLGKGRMLPRLAAGAERDLEDRPGLVRTRMSCEPDAR